PNFPEQVIMDISEDTSPVVVSKLMHEVHDAANCGKTAPDVVGLSIFVYGSHYCSVDNRRRATTLACGYFNSGIRVFDIRDPIRPREMGYYNPGGTTTPSPGSITFGPAAGLPVAPIGARRRCISMRTPEPCGRRARTMASS